MTRIALDAMGGDHAPAATIDGALIAAGEGIDVLLVGDAEALRREFARRGQPADRLPVLHAPDVIAMDDPSALAVRHRRQSSIYVATGLLQRGEAHALVTVGNTGAAMATALLVLGRLPGAERPALAALLPAIRSARDGAQGPPVLLLDAGANADARPAHLHQFARLGTAYMRAVHALQAPRVALLSIGEEASKGSQLARDAHRLLAADPELAFTGNIEGRDLFSGTADVVVTDGFTGNVALKLAEGVLQALLDELRRVAAASPRMRLGGALLLPGLRGMRDRLDYRRYGAVPLLGVNGTVFIGHGRSDASAVAGAIRSAHHAAGHHLLDALTESVATA